MVRDPTDEKYRKPRRLRNTELQKYIRFVSLAMTGFYGLAVYIHWRKHVTPILNDEQYKLDLNPNNPEMLQDYGYIFLKDIYNKLMKAWKKEDVSGTIQENIQTDKV